MLKLFDTLWRSNTHTSGSSVSEVQMVTCCYELQCCVNGSSVYWCYATEVYTYSYWSIKKNKMSLNIGFRVFGCPFRRTAVRISTNARVQILNIRNNDQINISTPVDQVRQDRSIVRATGVQSTEQSKCNPCN